MSFSRRSDKYPLSCQRFGIASVYVAERQNRLVIDRLPCKIFFTKVNNKFVASILCPCSSRRATINKRIEIVLVLRAPCSFYREYISLFSVLLHMTEAARQFRGLLLQHASKRLSYCTFLFFSLVPRPALFCDAAFFLRISSKDFSSKE